MIQYTDSYKPNSTAIESVYYDSENESMYIIYSRGLTYRYDNVDYRSFEDISQAESAGKAVNAWKMGRTLPGGTYLGYLFDSDFESREEDDNVIAFPDFNGTANEVREDTGLKEGNVVYLASKNLTMPTSTNTYEVEFRMDLTGDRTFSHFTKATSIEDAISKLSIISDALESVLTILSVKVIYERN